MTDTEKTETSPIASEHTYRPRALYIALWVTVVALAYLVAFAGFSPLLTGGLTTALLLALLFVGIPVGMAMIISATLCLFAVNSLRLAAVSLRASLYESIASWQFSVIPLFVLMGIALWTSGITRAAYEAARQWLGRLPGGLAIATTSAGAGLAASSGSTMATVMALGRISIPEMLKSGYSPALATGSVAMAGTLGQIIPPSILLVIYAGVAQTPVGPQLLAGVVPGLLLAAGFGLVAFLWAVVVPTSAPRPALESITWRSRFASISGVIPLGVVITIVIGGLASGVFTATESAAIGAIAAIVAGLFARGRRQFTLSAIFAFLSRTLRETTTSVAPLFLLLVGAALLTTAIARTGVAQWLSRWLASLDLDRVELLIILIVFYLILGMFLESLPMILLTVPILQQPLEAVDVDMVWFGLFLVVMCEIGAVFPPIGLVTFVVHRMVQSPEISTGVPISLPSVFKGVMPYVIVAVLMLLLFIFFPDIVLWLPSTSPAN